MHQVQGTDLPREISWSWASEAPPSAAAAIAALDGLRARLPPAAHAIRDEAFDRALRFIQNAAVTGGVDAPVSATFQNRRVPPASRTARVAIEVRTGRAFVP